jgi:hypothetical protein
VCVCVCVCVCMCVYSISSLLAHNPVLPNFLTWSIAVVFISTLYVAGLWLCPWSNVTEPEIVTFWSLREKVHWSLHCCIPAVSLWLCDPLELGLVNNMALISLFLTHPSLCRQVSTEPVEATQWMFNERMNETLPIITMTDICTGIFGFTYHLI